MTNVVVVTQDDPFYMPSFFEAFFRELPAAVEIESIVLLRPFDESTAELAHRLYRFYGLTNFLKLAGLYASRKLRDALGQSAFSVETLAQQQGIPTEHRETVNAPDFVEKLAEVDVLLSVSSPEIFEADVLDAPRWGCLNVHTANLPNYRGMMPTFWALYNGADEIGVTVHTMTEEIDKGEAVQTTAFPVNKEDSLSDVITRGKESGGQLAAAALGDIVEGNVSKTEITGEGSYYSFPTAEDRRTFQRQGGRLL